MSNWSMSYFVKTLIEDSDGLRSTPVTRVVSDGQLNMIGHRLTQIESDGLKWTLMDLDGLGLNLMSDELR